jgi:phosphatidylinositol 4-kinase
MKKHKTLSLDKQESNKYKTDGKIFPEEDKVTEDEELIKFKNRNRFYTTAEGFNQNNPLINDNNNEEKSESDHSSTNKYENSTSLSNFNDNMFGELIEEQAERLKKTSPFGALNTWKIFKMIVKSGEDLRQEQFATQLINEFYQIFKLEKVDCWVHTYEIIATGNQVGIIEMVPNSISIDQLKKKIKNNSLRQFFINYFGEVNTNSK